jgi:4-amino-4-deoxy-L-arabinose transferase-like glycosyltransferase
MLANKRKVLIIFLLVTFFTRLFFSVIYLDLNSEAFYFEYGNINKNIVAGKGYSLFYSENGKIKYEFNEKARPAPSAYMPPAYSLITLPFFFIQNIFARNFLIIIFQSILAVLAALFLYKLTAYLFGNNVGLIAMFIYAILPEFIYSTISFGPTLIYHIFIILIIYQFIRYQENHSNKYILRVLILSSILILFRMEFLLFALFLIIYLLFSKSFKLSFIGLLLIALILIPWQIRNFATFKTFIPLTTSGGLNLYRGHNLENPGIWADDKIDVLLKEIKISERFELDLNELYNKQAWTSIKQIGFYGEVKLAAQKLFHLWIFYPEDKKSTNLFYLLPWLILLTLSLIGIFKTIDLSKYVILYAFYFYHSILAVAFFALPRYQTMMKITLIPFAAFSIYNFWNSIKKKRNI